MPKWPGAHTPGRYVRRLTLCSANAGFDIFDDDQEYEKRPTATIDASDFILDIREYDVPYHVRVAIDRGTNTKRNQLQHLLINGRCTDWEMVHGRGKARRYFHDLYRRPSYAS
jgi:DNA polymerase elongation subunit (family B)